MNKINDRIDKFNTKFDKVLKARDALDYEELVKVKGAENKYRDKVLEYLKEIVKQNCPQSKEKP